MQKNRRKMRFFGEEVGAGRINRQEQPASTKKSAGARFQGAREDVRFMALPV